MSKSIRIKNKKTRRRGQMKTRKRYKRNTKSKRSYINRNRKRIIRRQKGGMFGSTSSEEEDLGVIVSKFHVYKNKYFNRTASPRLIYIVKNSEGVSEPVRVNLKFYISEVEKDIGERLSSGEISGSSPTNGDLTGWLLRKTTSKLIGGVSVPSVLEIMPPQRLVMEPRMGIGKQEYEGSDGGRYNIPIEIGLNIEKYTDKIEEEDRLLYLHLMQVVYPSFQIDSELSEFLSQFSIDINSVLPADKADIKTKVMSEMKDQRHISEEKMSDISYILPGENMTDTTIEIREIAETLGIDFKIESYITDIIGIQPGTPGYDDPLIRQKKLAQLLYNLKFYYNMIERQTLASAKQESASREAYERAIRQVTDTS